MMKRVLLYFLVLFLSTVQVIYAADDTVQDHYELILESYQAKSWSHVVRESKRMLKRFPSSPFSNEILYYMGVSYFSLKEYSLANEHFSKYLKENFTPKFFEEALEYKFKIASFFEEGAKKHLMGARWMPRLVSGRSDALAIYEEIITTLPRHDLAAQALYHKGSLLFLKKDFKESVQSYQTLIRRFPKHPLAIESYLGIGKVYLNQCDSEFPDPDFLDLAEINLKKFRSQFPSEPRIEEVESYLLKMKEQLADELFEVGNYYERTKKNQAAAIYYSSIIAKYPETVISKRAKKRLEALHMMPMVNPSKSEASILAESEPS